MGKASGRRILSGAKTAGGQVRLYRHMWQIDGHKIDDLSSSQEKRLRMVVARSGDDGVEAINRLDKDTVDDLLGMRRVCTRSGPGAFAATGSSCLDEETVQSAVRSVVKATDGGEVSDREITDAIQRINAMDAENRNQAIRVMADADADGVKFIGNLNDRTARKVFDSDLSSDSIASSARKYGDLDAEYQSKFMDVLLETDAGVAWVRTVGASGIQKSDVRKALDRVDSIDRRGHETKQFLTGRKANNQFKKNTPPHKKGTIVIDFEIKSDDKFWRLYEEGEDPASRWVVRPKTIQQTDDKDKLIDKLSLLPEEWNTDYNYVSTLKVKAENDLRVRMSTVGSVKGKDSGEYRNGGATQYMLRGGREYLEKELNGQWIDRRSLDIYIK